MKRGKSDWFRLHFKRREYLREKIRQNFNVTIKSSKSGAVPPIMQDTYRKDAEDLSKLLNLLEELEQLNEQF